MDELTASDPYLARIKSAKQTFKRERAQVVNDLIEEALDSGYPTGIEVNGFDLTRLQSVVVSDGTMYELLIEAVVADAILDTADKEHPDLRSVLHADQIIVGAYANWDELDLRSSGFTLPKGVKAKPCPDPDNGSDGLGSWITSREHAPALFAVLAEHVAQNAEQWPNPYREDDDA